MEKILVFLEIILYRAKKSFKRMKYNHELKRLQLFDATEVICHNIFSFFNSIPPAIESGKIRRATRNKNKLRMAKAAALTNGYKHKIFDMEMSDFTLMINRDIINLVRQYTSLERPDMKDGKIHLSSDYHLEMRAYVTITLLNRYEPLDIELDRLFYPGVLNSVIDLQYDLARIDVIPNIIKMTLEAIKDSVKNFE